jgi:predicted  nucleic acid-binding Zn-ribbon protein|tara:strand:- start:986 stop:1255 length:270 start_codon:yes stop_codon:yes gene_type:complete
MANIKGRSKGKVTKEELKEIQEKQNKVNSILIEVGYIESKKHALMHELADTNVLVEQNKKELQDKYGNINIDLTTGDWKKTDNVDNKKD